MENETKEQQQPTPLPWRIMQDGRRLPGGRGMAYDIFGDCNRAIEWQEYVAGKLSRVDAEFVVNAVIQLARYQPVAAAARKYRAECRFDPDGTEACLAGDDLDEALAALPEVMDEN